MWSLGDVAHKAGQTLIVNQATGVGKSVSAWFLTQHDGELGHSLTAKNSVAAVKVTTWTYGTP